MAILGISVAAAMQIFSGGLNNVRRIEMAHRAMNHAENVMNEILIDGDIIGPLELAGDLDEDFSYSAVVDYWEPPEPTLQLDIVQNRIDLLSVVVDIRFKNDRFGKRYRAVCLKAVALEPNITGLGGAVDPIQQLFGGQ